MACCDNCGAKLRRYGADCEACGFKKPTVREIASPITLVFCPTCGCVYADGCSFWHETQPFKPGA